MPKLRLYDYAASANCLKAAHPARAARPAVRARPDRHLRRRHAHRRVPGDQPSRARRRCSRPRRARSCRSRTRSSGTSPRARRSFPTTPLERAQVVRWLIFEQADLMPAIGGLRFRLVTGRLVPGDRDAVRRRTLAGEVLEAMQDHLALDAVLRRRALLDRRHRPLRVHACGRRRGDRPRRVCGGRGAGSSASRRRRDSSTTSSRTPERVSRRRPLDVRLGHVPVSIAGARARGGRRPTRKTWSPGCC